MSWIDAVRARMRLLFSRRDAESRMDQEISFHIEMETERLADEAGLDPAEARRRALIGFGGVQKHREELRESRGLAWLMNMPLDLKLGLRMLVKYPGLSLVGVLGMAVAVAIGTVSFGVIHALVDPGLPLDEGDRIVAVENLDARGGGDARRTHLHDLGIWRDALPAVELLSAYRTVDRNLITRENPPEPVRIAEMTESGFRVARVPALLGRTFTEEDERTGGPPVAVIGYDVWRSRFGGDSAILGRTLQLGAHPHTVIGVMPKGFAFPVNNRVWTPLRLNPSDFEPGRAPSIMVFGRLAPGITLGEAQAQLATIGARMASDHPETHEHIRPHVLSYALSFTDSPQQAWMFHLVQLGVTMLLVLVGTNVAILVHARTATRTGEMAVRTALGASRARVVAQLFVEALVLSGAAAAVGLGAGWLTLRELNGVVARLAGELLPFWTHFGLSPGTILYVAGLAVLGAVIVGALPALRALRGDVQGGLQQLGAGGWGAKLGRTWTVLVVAQVAVTVLILPWQIVGVDLWLRHRMAEPGFPASEFLTARLYLDREGAGTGDTGANDSVVSARYANLQGELVRRLEAEPRIGDVVIADALPGDAESNRIEIDGATGTAGPDSGAGSGFHRVWTYRVEPDFFPTFDVSLLTGRGFRPSDASADAAVIVNHAFVQQILSGGKALGRRVRAVARSGTGDEESGPRRWYEIVGVVSDFPRPVKQGILEPKLYHAMVPGAANPVALAVRVRGAPARSFAEELREMAVAVDPMLRIESVGTLDAQLHQDAQDQVVILVLTLVTLSVVLLSAAGIHALMSCSVSLRRHEIGIRTALGARPSRIIWSILARAGGQIGTGIGVGVLLLGFVGHMMVSEGLSGRDIVSLLAVAAFMMGVGLLATVGPARRVLRIQPTEALKAE